MGVRRRGDVVRCSSIGSMKRESDVVVARAEDDAEYAESHVRGFV